jgi:hypothetical protein
MLQVIHTVRNLSQRKQTLSVQCVSLRVTDSVCYGGSNTVFNSALQSDHHDVITLKSKMRKARMRRCDHSNDFAIYKHRPVGTMQHAAASYDWATRSLAGRMAQLVTCLPVPTFKLRCAQLWKQPPKTRVL